VEQTASGGALSEYTTAASALRCKECLRTGELTAAYVCEYCFGPLEVLYDMDLVASRV
jgi:threonine synthase